MTNNTSNDTRRGTIRAAWEFALGASLGTVNGSPGGRVHYHKTPANMMPIQDLNDGRFQLRDPSNNPIYAYITSEDEQYKVEVPELEAFAFADCVEDAMIELVAEIVQMCEEVLMKPDAGSAEGRDFGKDSFRARSLSGDSLGSYSEKRAREVILNKSNAVVRRSRSGHDVGFVYHSGVLLARIKIPNAHNKTMGEGLVNALARSLRLTMPQFALFMDCAMRAREYEAHLATLESPGYP